MEAARYERCATVSQALTLLRLEWATVLGEIEAAFNFGVLAGTEIERLSNALNVVITVEEPQVQTNAGTTPRWRPRFRYCDGGIQQVLGIPADRLAAHRNVMLVSYLLRASADYALKWVMPDPVHRNSVVRDEVDFLMFGTFPCTLAAMLKSSAPRSPLRQPFLTLFRRVAHSWFVTRTENCSE